MISSSSKVRHESDMMKKTQIVKEFYNDSFPTEDQDGIFNFEAKVHM